MLRRDRSLKPIQGLFAKYQQTLRAPQGTVIKTFREVVHDVLGIDISKETIDYAVSDRVIKVRASGVLSSEIRLHEEEILHHMKGRLGAKSAPRKII